MKYDFREFQILSVASMKPAIFWIGVSCSLVKVIDVLEVFVVSTINPKDSHVQETWSRKFFSLVVYQFMV